MPPSGLTREKHRTRPESIYFRSAGRLLEAGADLHAKEDWARRWAAKNGHNATLTVLEEWAEREMKKPAAGVETT